MTWITGAGIELLVTTRKGARLVAKGFGLGDPLGVPRLADDPMDGPDPFWTPECAPGFPCRTTTPGPASRDRHR